MEQKRCISSLTLAELTAELKALGQPGFRAKQIFHWVHQKLVTEFSAMTDQPKTLLAKLEETFYIAAPQIERRQEAKDGTVKYLLRMADGNCIETVVMRYHYGNTVCVSTQVGCRMGCRFCASTQAGRVRNLEAGEICSEIYTAQKDIGERISHIVLMGIGEPLDNFDEVMRFLENITSPEGVNIGMRNISLSTCGLVPKIDQLAEKKLQLTLSISLHAPTNQIRSSMMPVNDAYPVEQLIQAVRRYQETTGRRVSFEYSMVRGVNDSDVCAKQLADLIRGMGAHVNLIPINPVDGSPYSATDAANRYVFQKALREESLAGMGTTAVCALVRGGKAYLSHAGDSRAYLYRDGKLAQLTHDHSYVQELVDCGTITQEQAEHHPQKNIITRALGVDYRLEPEFTTVALQAGDVLLLCTDGLTNAVPTEQLEQLLRSGSFYDLPDVLIRTANENGGPDNITALLVGVEPMEVRHG